MKRFKILSVKSVAILLALFMLLSYTPLFALAATEYMCGDYTYTLSSNKATITSYPETAKGDVSIPSSLDGYEVVAIGSYSFYACTLINSVEVPDTVTSIGEYAFAFCTTLSNITIPTSVITIGANAFKNSNNVTIRCYSGSTAYHYAVSEGIPWILVSESKGYPIIIVPGIMGSRLFCSSSCSESSLVWAPNDITEEMIEKVKSELKIFGISAVGSLITLGFSQIAAIMVAIEAEIFTPTTQHVLKKLLKIRDFLPIENTLYVPSPVNLCQRGAKMEYGTLDAYKNTVNHLVEEYKNSGRAVYFFSYDWRKGSAENARKLNTFIKGLDSKKVDILAHSMGGLVVSSYISQYPDSNKVNVLITGGTPYEGAPAILSRTLTHNVLDDTFKDWALWVISGLNQSVKKQFAACSELTPTKRYVDKVPMLKDSFWIGKKHDYELDYKGYLDNCHKIYGETNYNNAKEFQESLLGEGGYNRLADRHNTYFIVGKLSGKAKNKTMSQVKFNYITTWSIDDFEYADGDGTVPYKSQTMMGEIFKRAPGRVKEFEVDHGGTVTCKKKTLGYIVEIFNSYLEKSSAGVAVKAGYAEVKTNEPYITLRLDGNTDIEIERNSEVLSSIGETSSVTSSFGRIDFIGVNASIKMVCLDNHTDYIIRITGNVAENIDYSVRWYNGEEERQNEANFFDILVSETSVITTSAIDKSGTVLYIDDDNDGVVDRTVQANEIIALDQSSLLMRYKDSATLNATSSSDRVTWTSSDTTVVTVDQNGIVKAIGRGTATITATVTGAEISDTCAVTVKYTWWQWLIIILLFGRIWY
ncbi:MAG: leucine-rich repeat protein [Clostridiaceae bacterium]|nr:leucine-rich repeat protein [Clostridiaceae bacterium]